MANEALKESYHVFSKVAAPYLHIEGTENYARALENIDALFKEVADNDDDPLNGLISLLGQAITHYEDGIESLAAFEKQAHEGPADVAMLRLIMDQHNLGVAGFPEIGDKSLISRILSGERNLNKQHIKTLSERFNVSPSLFF